MTNQSIIETLQRVGLGVLEAIEACGDTGAPGGPLYAAMQAHGASLNQFNSLMQGLVDKGMLFRDDWHCYHMTPAGIRFKTVLLAKFGPPTGRTSSANKTQPGFFAHTGA